MPLIKLLGEVMYMYYVENVITLWLIDRPIVVLSPLSHFYFVFETNILTLNDFKD